MHENFIFICSGYCDRLCNVLPRIHWFTLQLMPTIMLLPVVYSEYIAAARTRWERIQLTILWETTLYRRPYYVEVAVIIAIMLIQLRKSECSTEVTFLSAAACALGTMQPCQEHRVETSLMFTLACHASFLLLCHRHVCQVLFRHNVAIHCTLNRS